MSGDYKVNRCTRQCSALERPLKEGEWYYSVIVEDGDDYKRVDYSAESWSQPPAEAIGWWRKQMPTAAERKRVLAPPEILIDLLRQMQSFPAKQKSRYLLALMLMRRRLLRPHEPGGPILGAGPEVSPGQNERKELAGNEAGTTETSQRSMTFEVIADGSLIEVPVVAIGRNEAETLTEQLDELLYCDASDGDASDGDASDGDASDGDASDGDASDEEVTDQNE